MGILARIGFHPDCNAGQQKGACNTRLLVTWELVVHECTRRTNEFTVYGRIRKPQFHSFSEDPSLPGRGVRSGQARMPVTALLRVAVLFFLAPKTRRGIIVQPRAALDVNRLTLHLAAHRHRHEVVARASQRRRATAETAAGWIAAPGDPDELENLSEKRLVDRRFPTRPTGAATTTGTRTGCSSTASRTGGPRSRRLRRTGDEPLARCRTTPEATKATATAHELCLDTGQ